MNTTEDRVRMVIGDLTLQLIVAQQRSAELEQQLAALQAEQPPAKPNGKAPAEKEARAQ